MYPARRAKPSKFRRNSSIAIGDQRIGQAHVSKYRAHEVGGGRRRGHRLERWDKPDDAPRQNVDVHLQEIMPGLRDRHLQEVQTNYSAPARRHGKRENKASRATMFGFKFDALASGAGADECFDVRIERRPPNGTLSQGQGLSRPKLSPRGVAWSSVRVNCRRAGTSRIQNRSLLEERQKSKPSRAKKELRVDVLSAGTGHPVLSTCLPCSWVCRKIGPRNGSGAVAAATDAAKSAYRNRASSTGEPICVKSRAGAVEPTCNNSDDPSP
jgi:hypothetical protein